MGARDHRADWVACGTTDRGSMARIGRDWRLGAPQAENRQYALGAPAASQSQSASAMKYVLDTDILIDVLRG